ncbi:hypothetical protein W97_09187 [Coniosporium apollinis CBS 100218]|uniref:Uncharacterized protein n=1 Tax=Coniosporium apollinis (strain CBS 100218) TaxID=1168221 RepID=R7Z6Y3_CONA1|nr:uncharacterized protein W97_09187 [Coniosporium apollinis CBS 100218]EON69922.1 hypothetical protein W97_09187 [Coniosporium apollinis CBS 100218]
MGLAGLNPPFEESWRNEWESRNEVRHGISKRAIEIYESVYARQQTKLEGTLAKPPDNSAKSQKLRETLSRHHTTRQALLEAVKHLQDLELCLTRMLTDQVIKSTDPRRQTLFQTTVDRLQRVGKALSSIRGILRASTLNNKGIEIIDNRLESWIEDDTTGMLMTIPDRKTQDQIQAEQDEIETDEKKKAGPQTGEKEIRDKIKKKHNFTTRFLLNCDSGHTRPFDVRSPKVEGVLAIQRSKAITGSMIMSGPELRDADERLAKWLEELSSNEIEASRFKLNYRTFERQIRRPKKIVQLKPDANFWTRPAYRLPIILDNIYHIRRMMTAIFDRKLTVGSSDKDGTEAKLHQKLRRMYGLLAIMFGCVSEGSLWLPVMDKLLEDLAEEVVGHVDPAYETITMTRKDQIMANLDQNVVRTRLPSGARNKARIDDLSRFNEARKLFAELALFYRGAICLAFAAVSVTRGNQVIDQDRLWYEELIKQSAECGYPGCLEQLRITKSKKPGAETHAFGLSVGVKDPRLGFPTVRADYSDNRPWAYPCLFYILHHNKYNVAFTPFYHWFAHLYHIACKPFRGKEMIIFDLKEIDKIADEETKRNKALEARRRV